MSDEQGFKAEGTQVDERSPFAKEHGLLDCANCDAEDCGIRKAPFGSQVEGEDAPKQEHTPDHPFKKYGYIDFVPRTGESQHVMTAEDHAQFMALLKIVGGAYRAGQGLPAPLADIVHRGAMIKMMHELNSHGFSFTMGKFDIDQANEVARQSMELQRMIERTAGEEQDAALDAHAGH